MRYEVTEVAKYLHVGYILLHEVLHLFRIVYHAGYYSQYHDSVEKRTQELFYDIDVKFLHAELLQPLFKYGDHFIFPVCIIAL